MCGYEVEVNTWSDTFCRLPVWAIFECHTLLISIWISRTYSYLSIEGCTLRGKEYLWESCGVDYMSLRNLQTELESKEWVTSISTVYFSIHNFILQTVSTSCDPPDCRSEASPRHDDFDAGKHAIIFPFHQSPFQSWACSLISHGFTHRQLES